MICFTNVEMKPFSSTVLEDASVLKMESAPRVDVRVHDHVPRNNVAVTVIRCTKENGLQVTVHNMGRHHVRFDLLLLPEEQS